MTSPTTSWLTYSVSRLLRTRVVNSPCDSRTRPLRSCRESRAVRELHTDLPLVVDSSQALRACHREFIERGNVDLQFRPEFLTPSGVPSQRSISVLLLPSPRTMSVTVKSYVHVRRDVPVDRQRPCRRAWRSGSFPPARRLRCPPSRSCRATPCARHRSGPRPRPCVVTSKFGAERLHRETRKRPVAAQCRPGPGLRYGIL